LSEKIWSRSLSGLVETGSFGRTGRCGPGD
jgi:hypothetical protein